MARTGRYAIAMSEEAFKEYATVVVDGVEKPRFTERPAEKMGKHFVLKWFSEEWMAQSHIHGLSIQYHVPKDKFGVYAENLSDELEPMKLSL